MKKILINLIGEKNFSKIERLKKRVFPTIYDKQQKKHLADQLHFYSQLIKPNDLCFDIGGNIGLKTRVFLQLKARVVTLEPQQDCINILQETYGDKAIILQKGVGAVNEIKDFYVSNNSQLSSFDDTWVNELKDGRFEGSHVERIEKIEIVTLDSLIDKYGSPNFIKIDVEGYEVEVLKGLNVNFNCLSFEYAVPEKINEVFECLSSLKKKYANLICNYAIGNAISSFALDKWITIDEMFTHVQLSQFQDTFAGDIYIKTT